MFKNILKVTITILLVAYLLIYIVDLNQVIHYIKGAKWNYFLVAYFVNLIGIILSTLRWRAILNLRSIRVNYIKLISYYFMGIFYNNFIPGSVGGDTVKMYKIGKERHENRTFLIASVIVDRFIGLLVVYFTGIIVFILNYNELDTVFRIFFLFILLAYSLIIMVFSRRSAFNILFKLVKDKIKLSSKLQTRILDIYESINIIKELSNNKQKAIQIFLPSIGFFFGSYIGEVFILLYALDCPLSYINLLSFMPILNLIVMLPISFGGLGVREYMYVFFLGSENISAEIAFSLCILLLSFRIINSLIGAFINLIEK